MSEETQKSQRAMSSGSVRFDKPRRGFQVEAAVEVALCSREIKKGKLCHNHANFSGIVRAEIRIQRIEN